MGDPDSCLSKACNAHFQDCIPNSAAGILTCGGCFCVNFVLIILFFPCTVTQLGQYKLGLVRNKVTGYVDVKRPHEPGRYWIGFWKEFIEFPSTLNTIEFSEEQPEKGVQHLSVLKSRDKEGKNIKLDISIQYLLRAENLGLIYTDMLTFYEDIYISELRDSIAKAANLFVVADAWENYTSVVDIMTLRCQEVLKKRHAECWGLQLWGITLSPQYESKLILTQVKKQARRTQLAIKDKALIRAQTQVLLANYKKNITIVKAIGEANKYNIEQLANSTAQANLVSAQAQSLQIVKDLVCPTYAKTNGNCTSQMSLLNGSELVHYQKMVMLKGLNDSHLVYNMRGGVQPEAMNVEATRNIMHGRVRRRLLDHGWKAGSASKLSARASGPSHPRSFTAVSGFKAAAATVRSKHSDVAHAVVDGAHEL